MQRRRQKQKQKIQFSQFSCFSEKCRIYKLKHSTLEIAFALFPSSIQESKGGGEIYRNTRLFISTTSLRHLRAPPQIFMCYFFLSHY